MSELAYSLHLGSDKNRKNISKQNGKNNLSGTTSLPNYQKLINIIIENMIMNRT